MWRARAKWDQKAVASSIEQPLPSRLTHRIPCSFSRREEGGAGVKGGQVAAETPEALNGIAGASGSRDERQHREGGRDETLW